MIQLKKEKGQVKCGKRDYTVLFSVCLDCPHFVQKEEKIFCKVGDTNV